jgi:Rieske Fe-S protein
MAKEPRSVELSQLLEQLARGGCDPTRRAFCAGAAAGASLILLGAGCDSGSPRLSEGSVDNQPNGPTPANPDGTQDFGTSNPSPDAGTSKTDLATSKGDLATGNNPVDMAGGGTSQPDLAHGGTSSPDLASGSTATCSGSVNAGPASAIALNTAQNITQSTADFWLCRDSKGLYALDNYCPHRGCNVNLQTDNTFYCYCHGAQFGLDGSRLNTVSPSPMFHLAVCIDGSGNAIVDPSKTVSATTRV